MPSLTVLSDAFLIGMLRYCDSITIAKASQLNRRFRTISEHPNLWKHVIVSGHCTKAALFVEQILIKKATLINYMSLERISFVKSPQAATEVFFATIDKLLQLVGDSLVELRIDDSRHYVAIDAPKQFNLPVPASLLASSSPDSLFGNVNLLIGSLANYCRNLKTIVLSGDAESLYVGDANIALLVKACPLVESFVDEESCGLTAEAIRTMAGGWHHLTSLALDTECMDVFDFEACVSLFGDRLKNLSITNFVDPLDTECFETLLSGLKKLINLRVLAIDHSHTRYLDGLDEPKMRQLTQACPNLMGFEYFSTIQCYFDFEDDSSSLGSNSVAEHDPDSLLEAWKTHRARHNTLSTRRGSIGSVSMATTRFGGKIRGGGGTRTLATLSVFSGDDGERGDDVTSLAPAMPSPNEDNRNRVEVYGMWQSGDKLSIRERALRILGFENGSNFFVDKQEVFFAILDSVYSVCKDKGVKVTFAWSI